MDIIDENNFGKAATKYLLGGGTTTKYDPNTGRAYTAPVNGKLRDAIGITPDNPVGSALAAYGYLQNAKAGAERARWEREQEKARREAEAEQRKLAQEQQRFSKMTSQNETAERDESDDDDSAPSDKAEKLKQLAKDAVKDATVSAGKKYYRETHWVDQSPVNEDFGSTAGQKFAAFKQNVPGQAKDIAKGVGDYVIGAAISHAANAAVNRAGYYGAKAKYAMDDRMANWKNATLEKARAKAEREKLQLAEKQYREQQRLEQKQAKEAQKAGTSL